MSEHDLRGRQAAPALAKGKDFLFSALELFPIPMEVFSPDGTSLFVNGAFLEHFCISDPSEIVGKLNILQDPYINRKLGLTDYLRRVFSGELLSYCEIRAPVEQIGSRYIAKHGKPVENDMYHNITCFPLWNRDGTVAYVAALFMAKQIHQLRLDAIRAKEYIDGNWLDDFDLDKIAAAASLSRRHMARLFKRFIGMTPYSYYQEVKLEKIKEALRDTNLRISEAFASCGADYSGCFAQAFKKKTGMTPSQYRRALQTEPLSAPGPGREDKRRGSPRSCYPSFDETEEQLFETAALFPIPIQIFKPNGDIVFINEAVLGMWNILDSSQILGSYNLIKDPFVNEQSGLRDYIRRAFQGEIVLIPDIRIPLQSFWEWYKTRSSVYDIESIYTDIMNFPVFKADGEMAYMVSIFFTSRLYQGRPDVAKAREYLENHWREEYDADKLAQAVSLSPSHLSRLFKKHTGMTPYSYYRDIKINRLKEALMDRNLSVAQAFVSCGFEYSGNLAGFFKEMVGMTPSQYRNTADR